MSLSIILAVLFVIGYTAAVVIMLTKVRRGAGNTSPGNITKLEEKISEMDNALESGLERLRGMSSLELAREKQRALEVLQAEARKETAKLAELDEKLSTMQTKAEVDEAAHNELKRGREDCEELAQQLRDSKEQLRSERMQLQERLQDSREQVQVLSKEVELTSEQKQALSQLASMLDRARDQLIVMAEAYEQASSRYVNLESQFEELEREFTKLVEKELSTES